MINQGVKKTESPEREIRRSVITEERKLERDESNIILKFILLGDSGVGKSNLLSRYLFNKFSVGANTTIGLEFSSKKMILDGEEISVQIWDTAGQERFRCINKSFYRNAIGAMIVFDVTNKSSFDSVPNWIAELKQEVPECAAILLIGNKIDDEQHRVVNCGLSMEFAKTHGIGYLQTSAATDFNVSYAFQMLTQNSYHCYKLQHQQTQIKRSVKVLESPIKKSPKDKKKCC